MKSDKVSDKRMETVVIVEKSQCLVRSLRRTRGYEKRSPCTVGEVRVWVGEVRVEEGGGEGWVTVCTV